MKSLLYFLFYSSLSYFLPHFIHNSLDFPHHVCKNCRHLMSRTLSLSLYTGVCTISMDVVIFSTPASVLDTTSSSRLLATSIEPSISASSSPYTVVITALVNSLVTALIVLLALSSKPHGFHDFHHDTHESSHGRIGLH